MHADVIPTLTMLGDALRNDRVLTWVIEGNKWHKFCAKHFSRKLAV